MCLVGSELRGVACQHDWAVELGTRLTFSAAMPATRILSSPPIFRCEAASAISRRRNNREAGVALGSCSSAVSDVTFAVRALIEAKSPCFDQLAD
jgi:hypothetical protein